MNNKKDIPAYYPYMYLDGYTPEEIKMSHHKSMLDFINKDEKIELSKDQEKEL